MDEIVKRLHEQKQIEKAKAILESEGYEVKMNEDGEERSEKPKLADMKANPTYKKMEEICQTHGYVLQRAYVEVYSEDSEIPYISIRQAQKDFRPDVYYNNDIWREREGFFEIQTTAYGTLAFSEYGQYLSACQDAYAMVTELSSLDLSTLYKIDRSKED